MIDYILFGLLLLIFFSPPIYLWTKWISKAIKNNNRIGKIASISSFVLFISGWIISWFGPEDPFEHNSIQLTLTGFYLVLHFTLTFSIPVVYYLLKWLVGVIKK